MAVFCVELNIQALERAYTKTVCSLVWDMSFMLVAATGFEIAKFFQM